MTKVNKTNFNEYLEMLKSYEEAWFYTSHHRAYQDGILQETEDQCIWELDWMYEKIEALGFIKPMRKFLNSLDCYRIIINLDKKGPILYNELDKTQIEYVAKQLGCTYDDLIMVFLLS